MLLSVVHNILMIGPPDAGKTLLARSLPAVLPYMTIDEALDVTRIYSVADLLPPDLPLIRNRPFFALHITPFRMPGLSAGEHGLIQERYPWLIAAFCS